MTNRISLKFEFPLINICRGKEGERKTGFWNLAKYFRLVKVTLTKVRARGNVNRAPRRMHRGSFREPVMERRGEWGGRRGMVYVNAATLSEINFRRSLLSTAFAIYTRPPVEMPLSFSPISQPKKKRQKEIGSLRRVKDVVVLFEFRWNERRRNEWRYLKEFNVVDIYKICALLHGDGLDWNSRFRSSESNVWFRRALYLDLEEILRGTYCTVVGSD